MYPSSSRERKLDAVGLKETGRNAADDQNDHSTRSSNERPRGRVSVARPNTRLNPSKNFLSGPLPSLRPKQQRS